MKGTQRSRMFQVNGCKLLTLPHLNNYLKKSDRPVQKLCVLCQYAVYSIEPPVISIKYFDYALHVLLSKILDRSCLTTSVAVVYTFCLSLIMTHSYSTRFTTNKKN